MRLFIIVIKTNDETEEDSILVTKFFLETTNYLINNLKTTPISYPFTSSLLCYTSTGTSFRRVGDIMKVGSLTD